MRRTLQILLAVLGTLLIVRFGLTALLLGPAWTMDPAHVTPFLDSEYRWFGAIFATLGAMCLWMVPRVERHAGLLRILMLGAFLGGVMRVVSMLQVGMPKRPAVTATLIELTLPLVLLALLYSVERQSNATRSVS